MSYSHHDSAGLPCRMVFDLIGTAVMCSVVLCVIPCMVPGYMLERIIVAWQGDCECPAASAPSAPPDPIVIEASVPPGTFPVSEVPP